MWGESDRWRAFTLPELDEILGGLEAMIVYMATAGDSADPRYPPDIANLDSVRMAREVRREIMRQRPGDAFNERDFDEYGDPIDAEWPVRVHAPAPPSGWLDV